MIWSVSPVSSALSFAAGMLSNGMTASVTTMTPPVRRDADRRDRGDNDRPPKSAPRASAISASPRVAIGGPAASTAVAATTTSRCVRARRSDRPRTERVPPRLLEQPQDDIDERRRHVPTFRERVRGGCRGGSRGSVRRGDRARRRACVSISNSTAPKQTGRHAGRSLRPESVSGARYLRSEDDAGERRKTITLVSSCASLAMPKVKDLRPARSRQEDVVRLQIAMHQSCVVRGRKSRVTSIADRRTSSTGIASRANAPAASHPRGAPRRGTRDRRSAPTS